MNINPWFIFMFFHVIIFYTGLILILNIIFAGTFGCDDESKPPEGGNIITTTRSHSNKTVVESIEACEPTEVIRVGGAGHKVSEWNPTWP